MLYNKHMKSIACIGQGFVGGSLTTVFAERGFDVFAYDKSGKYKPGAKAVVNKHGDAIFPHLVEELVTEAEKVEHFSKVYFVCLPTPMYEDGEADLSIVEGVLEQLTNIPGERIVVVKSTVPPGSVERWNNVFGPRGLHIVFNPEFLREATALDDMRNQDRIILGGPRPWINQVRDVFQSAFPTVPIFKTSSTNAEMVKYVINTFLATKVSFANEIYQICEKIADFGQNCDYDRIIELSTLDSRLGKSHWKVPSFEVDENGRPLKGYSLSCFPKDVNALITLAKKLGVDPKVLSAGWQKNLEVRPNKDWERLLGRAVSKKS